MPLMHGWRTANTVEFVCAFADAEAGRAVFKGKGPTNRRSMKRIAASLPSGWNATVSGHQSVATVATKSDLFDEFGTILTVWRDGVDPSKYSWWANA